MATWTIQHTTEFGIGILKIKAQFAEQAFNKLSKKNKKRCIDILDEDMNSIHANLIEFWKSEIK